MIMTLRIREFRLIAKVTDLVMICHSLMTCHCRSKLRMAHEAVDFYH